MFLFRYGPVLSIVRLPDGSLVSAFHGKASDSPNTCSPDVPKTDHHCYSLAFFTSVDSGLSWKYVSNGHSAPEYCAHTCAEDCSPPMC